MHHGQPAAPSTKRRSPTSFDIAGLRFGRLVVLHRCPTVPGQPAGWFCRCDCGTLRTAKLNALVTGKVKSCGCLSPDVGRANAKHGSSRVGQRTVEYKTWCGMTRRCRDTSTESAAYYGARGVVVCSRWRTSFAAFLADMGPRPADKKSIDRIDGRRGYECGSPSCPDCGPAGATPNCRWADAFQQNQNKSDNVPLTLAGETMLLEHWALRLGMPKNTLWNRIFRLGWTVEAALTTPTRSVGRRSRSASHGTGAFRAWPEGSGAR